MAYCKDYAFHEIITEFSIQIILIVTFLIYYTAIADFIFTSIFTLKIHHFCLYIILALLPALRAGMGYV